MSIQLGDEVRDKISGYSGVVVARAEWLYGCIRIGVKPRKIDEKTGHPVADAWFDEPQLEIVHRVNTTPPPPRTGGGGPEREENMQ